MTHYEQLGVLWHANLEATRCMATFGLEAGTAVFRMQMEATQRLAQHSSEHLEVLLTTPAEERIASDQFVICSDIMKRAMEAARTWVEAAAKAQADLSRIAGTRLTATGQSLIEAWLSAAKAGQEVSAVTERHQHTIAEGRTSKAA